MIVLRACYAESVYAIADYLDLLDKVAFRGYKAAIVRK
jgi:hypothetical protein